MQPARQITDSTSTGPPELSAEAREALVAAGKEAANMKAALDAHSIVAITDAAGKITYVNDRFCEISEFSREELLGRDHRIINSGVHPKSFFADLWHTIGRGKIWQGEICNRAKGGSHYWVQTTILPIVDTDGKPGQYIAIRTDVTARKRDEERLKQFAEELASKNKELETVIYVLSHDLRSPLLNVQGFGATLSNLCRELQQLLADGDISKAKNLLQAEVPRALHFIESGITRLNKLLDGFLRFSRLGRVALRIEPVDMNVLMAGCVQMLSFQKDQTKADIIVEALPVCLGDATLLGQVFSNLIENALKYRNEACPCRIRIVGQQLESEVVYTVTDNGIGIAADHQAKIFELFHRLNPKQTPGEGLGLTIAQRIVERLHGRIWLDSAVEKGTNFHIALPPASLGLPTTQGQSSERDSHSSDRRGR